MPETTIAQDEAKYLKDFLTSVIQDAKNDEKAFTQDLEGQTPSLIDTFSDETAIVPMKGFSTFTFLDKMFEGKKCLSSDGHINTLEGVPLNSNTLLTGLPSSGKSLYLMEVALRVASSGKNVCYVTSEEIFKSEAGRYAIESRMFERANKMGLSIENIKQHLFIIDTVKHAELREWINFVGEYRRLVANKKIELLIIDSITMLEDNRTQMKNRLLDLSRFNQTHGVTSIMINQRSVEESDNLAMAGGIALSHIVDTVIVMDYKKVSSWDGTLKMDIPTAKQGAEIKFFRILKSRLAKFDARYFAYTITEDGLINVTVNPVIPKEE
jgi:KaiC/GvpD/RAD55 family RecA-like ATPase